MGEESSREIGGSASWRVKVNVKPGFSDIAGAILYLWLALAYVVYITRGALPSDKAPGRRKAGIVLVDRTIFFLAFLVLPSSGLTLAGYDLPGLQVISMGQPAAWAVPVMLLGSAAFALGRFSRKTAADTANYPQYLPLHWNAASVLFEIVSWSLYLFAYEFAFRGMILFGLLPAGYWTAIAIQTALYAFAHLPKSGKEAAGAIVFGVITSLITLAWGTMIPAFLVHLALALGNDVGCMRAIRNERNVRT